LSEFVGVPTGVAINAKDEIIVSEQEQNRMLVYDITGKLLFEFGGHGRLDEQFIFPKGNFVHCADMQKGCVSTPKAISSWLTLTMTAFKSLPAKANTLGRSARVGAELAS